GGRACHKEPCPPRVDPATGPSEQLTSPPAGDSSNAFVAWYATRLQETLARLGHVHRSANSALDGDAPADRTAAEAQPPVRLVLNLCDVDRPRPVHRRGQGTFVATIVEAAYA